MNENHCGGDLTSKLIRKTNSEVKIGNCGSNLNTSAKYKYWICKFANTE